jgi:hypothetical protein
METMIVIVYRVDLEGDDELERMIDDAIRVAIQKSNDCNPVMVS